MRKEEYRGNDFSVRIEPIIREVVSVSYTCHGSILKMEGELIGPNWEGIGVKIPESIEDGQVAHIVRDLEAAFVALGIGYKIDRRVGIDIVPEPERQAALAELRAMGHEIEVLPGQGVRLTKRAGAPPQDIGALRQQTTRMMSLIMSVQGTRQRIETLAKSKDF